jgi:signal transduction histidine kinase
MRYLAAHIQSAREEERTRIARQMHDELGQLLTAIKINCSRIQMNVPETGACPKLRTVVDLVDQTIVTVRRLATELRPGILDLGLQAAIEWQAQEFEERSEIACHVEYRGADNDLDPKCATELFRIFQEILTNVARHSGATEVQVTLIRDSEQLVMEVRDNGRGVSPEEVNSRTALGILGMKERAALIGGAVIIAGQPGTGTRVQVRIPLRSALSARQAS